MRATVAIVLVLLGLVLPAADLRAHAGPPFPIVSDRRAGPYLVSVWTDPDTTEDGSPGGQFWVMMSVDGSSTRVPDATRAVVTAAPANRPGPTVTGAAEPVSGNVSTQFAGVVLADEGRFDVLVTIEGPLGPARVEAQVDATYDLRPSPLSMVVYLMPFLLIGGLWTRLLLRRRTVARHDARPGDGNSA